jgi:hypothetical protein
MRLWLVKTVLFCFSCGHVTLNYNARVQFSNEFSLSDRHSSILPYTNTLHEWQFNLLHHNIPQQIIILFPPPRPLSKRKACGHPTAQEIPTWLFIIAFTRTCNWTLSWAMWIQTIGSHPISVLISIYYPSTCTQISFNWSLPSGFSNKNFVQISQLSEVCYKSYPPQTTLFNHLYHSPSKWQL